jgi:ribonuclease P protein component
MNRSAEFATIVRDGRRIRSGCIVLHSGVLPDTDRQPRVGLVVGRSVGGSVDLGEPR